MPARIGEFTWGQLVSLRFASDAELPALARKVLDEKFSERKVELEAGLFAGPRKRKYPRPAGLAIVAVVEARKCCE